MANRKKKEVLDLPQDCEKLATSACESKKTRDPKTGARKCKIRYSKLGFNNKCVANQDYDLEKFIFEQGFQEFSSISGDNLEKELQMRNKICENLDASSGGTCQSSLGEKLGCKINKKLLSPNSCRLDPKLIRFLKKRELLCEKDDCSELKKKGIICKKCTDELGELLQEHDGLFQILAKRKNAPPADIARFFEVSDIIRNEWYPYFVTGQQKLLDTLEKKKIKIEEIHGRSRCQAINITSCHGKGDDEKQCSCKGFKDSNGLFCGTHRKCYLQRVENFDEFRDNFDELCNSKGLCPPLIRKMEQFYEMIKYTTVGEASRKKIEVSNILDYAEEYMKYR